MLDLLRGAAFGYGALVIAVFLFQRHMIYFPDRTRPAAGAFVAAGMVPALVDTDDGLQLSGWYRPPLLPHEAVVVYFHGNGGHIGHRIPKAGMFVRAGCGVLLAEYRGYGGNPGAPTEAGLYHDGRAYLDFLAGQGVPPARTVLFGESLGAAVAMQMATERPVAAVILEAPFTSLADAGARHYPWLPVHLLLRDRYETLSKMGRLAAPLLVLHGERDQVVPSEHGRRLLAAAPEPKRGVFLPAADHIDVFGRGGAEAAAAFLAERCRPSGTGLAPPSGER